MIQVGIDIAKLNHFASVVSSDGEVLVEPFEFSNDVEGFRKLSSKLDPFEKDNLLIGLESTAHYGNNLVEFLFSKGYRFCILARDFFLAKQCSQYEDRSGRYLSDY